MRRMTSPAPPEQGGMSSKKQQLSSINNNSAAAAAVPVIHLRRISNDPDTHAPRLIQLAINSARPITVGRQGDRVIDSARDPGSISRIHAVINCDPSGKRIYVENTSTNGMLIDNSVLARGTVGVVRLGQTVTFGLSPTELHYRVLACAASFVDAPQQPSSVASSSSSASSAAASASSSLCSSPIGSQIIVGSTAVTPPRYSSPVPPPPPSNNRGNVKQQQQQASPSPTNQVASPLELAAPPPSPASPFTQQTQNNNDNYLNRASEAPCNNAVSMSPVQQCNKDASLSPVNNSNNKNRLLPPLAARQAPAVAPRIHQQHHDAACQTTAASIGAEVGTSMTINSSSNNEHPMQQQNQLRSQISLSMLVTDGGHHPSSSTQMTAQQFASLSSIDVVATGNGLALMQQQQNGTSTKQQHGTGSKRQHHAAASALAETTSIDDTKSQLANSVISLLLSSYDRATDKFNMTIAQRQNLRFALLMLSHKVAEMHREGTANNNNNAAAVATAGTASAFTSSATFTTASSTTASTAPSLPGSLLCTMEPPAFVFGDLHGSFVDLLFVYEKCIAPLGSVKYMTANLLFLGDYVDRGPHSVEVVAFLFALKVLAGHRVCLLRANHECPEVNGDSDQYGDGCFLRQIQRICSNNPQQQQQDATSSHNDNSNSNIDAESQMLWEACNDAFSWLPLACIVGGDVFACHAGIPRAALLSPEEFNQRINDEDHDETRNRNNKRSNNSNHNPATNFLELLQQQNSTLRFSRVMPDPVHDSPATAFRRSIARELLWNDPAASTETTTAEQQTNHDADDVTMFPLPALAKKMQQQQQHHFDPNQGQQQPQEQDQEAGFDHLGFRPNAGRGAVDSDIVLEFTQHACNTFLERYRFSLMLRAHQLKSSGLQLQHAARVITIFSSSNYAAGRNAAGGCLIDTDRKLRMFSWFIPLAPPPPSTQLSVAMAAPPPPLMMFGMHDDGGNNNSASSSADSSQQFSPRGLQNGWAAGAAAGLSSTDSMMQGVAQHADDDDDLELSAMGNFTARDYSLRFHGHSQQQQLGGRIPKSAATTTMSTSGSSSSSTQHSVKFIAVSSSKKQSQNSSKSKVATTVSSTGSSSFVDCTAHEDNVVVGAAAAAAIASSNNSAAAVSSSGEFLLDHSSPEAG